ncbi:hypothetical protein [Pseudomonas sp. JV245A]|uniref:hypothetical protein n=1 Tax=Pseudomonas sp. JV245A TaxID=1890668 RepID=UPI0028E0F50F|nr:hypothetical protein [Pseudomonas sp. JV245A]MDT9644609.1 hypothetical protein [Pseudomonas sp. JV245A]
MLSIEDQNFISNEMSISLASISSKLSEHALFPYRDHLESAIAFFISSIRAQNKSGYLFCVGSFQLSPAQVQINNYSAELSENLADTEALPILDSLRHAFFSFARNGLHELFTCQENEEWYPKVILSKELRPNDISELPSLVTLYRGTDIAEHNSSSYGQSWTTCKEIAYFFAFEYYVGQPSFDVGKRVILKTKITKEHVYFSNQTGEFEVVIDVGKILHVEVV